MATYQIPVTEHMNCNGDVPTNCKIFREAYEDYLIVAGLNKKDKAIQVTTLKSLMGIGCKKILKRLQLSADEMKEPEIILGKLESHFIPKRNILYERYIFHNTEQQAQKTINQFLIKLRQLNEPCKFGTLEDEMVQDRLVLGCKDNAARTRLFRKQDCNLKKSIESLRISREATSVQLKKIQKESAQEPVSSVKKEVSKRMPVQKQPEGPRTGRQSKEGRECRYCGALRTCS